jgi:predicted RNA-binding protein YlqC (UPF0109 family)
MGTVIRLVTIGSDDTAPRWSSVDDYRGDHETVLDVQINWTDLAPKVRGKVQELSNIVLTFVGALIDNEGALTLRVNANHRRVMFTVHVETDDLRFAIGGRRECDECGKETKAAHANALRSILIAACRKLDFHAELDIVGPTGDVDWTSRD